MSTYRIYKMEVDDNRCEKGCKLCEDFIAGLRDSLRPGGRMITSRCLNEHRLSIMEAIHSCPNSALSLKTHDS